MKLRLFAFLAIVVMIAACAPEAPAPPPEPPPMTDAEAIDAVRAAYVEHYNLGHADVVADLYTEDGVTLFADGGVNMGRAAIAASLADVMAMNPTARIDVADTMVAGDTAVTRGTYGIDAAPEGADPFSFGGNYMTVFRRVEGGWKIGLVIANYDGPAPVGMPAGAAPDEAPPDILDSAISGLTAAYSDHFNQGHASVVAAMYDEDGVAAFANAPLAEGRAAIEAALTERMAAGSPQLTIHTVDVTDMGGGWFVGGGWYSTSATMDGAAVTGTGNWVTLVRTGEDGTQTIHWALSNADPAAE